LISALDGGECSASRPGSFIPGEIASDTRWIGDSVDHRTGLDAVEKKKSQPCLEKSPSHPPRSLLLYRISHPGSSSCHNVVKRKKKYFASVRSLSLRIPNIFVELKLEKRNTYSLSVLFNLRFRHPRTAYLHTKDTVSLYCPSTLVKRPVTTKEMDLRLFSANEEITKLPRRPVDRPTGANDPKVRE
jgi:hypothetical protein